MNDYRGLIIKHTRKKMDISLEALSHGICSPSYLSKIENNLLIANDDIYTLCLKKLGIHVMNPAKEEIIENKLNLFFNYYLSSNLKALKLIDELLPYKDVISTSSLFISYQLFLLFASETNSNIHIDIKEIEEYYPFMNDTQKEYINLFKLSSGHIELSKNDDWLSIRKLKAKANLYMYQNHTFKAYDLYKTCLNSSIELGNKTLTAEILCSLGWLCLNIDLNQAETYYQSAVHYDTQFQNLAFYNLGATMIQHKKYVQKGKHYLTKGLTHCKDEFLKIKFNEALFIYSVLYTDKKNTEKGIHNISQSKYIDFFSMMLEDNYESNLNYQRQLMELKNTSSLFRFLFIENCKFQRKYKDIYVTNNWV